MKKSIIAGLMLATAGSLASITAWADGSPVGLWKTIDDHSGRATSLIRISETDGKLDGKIEKLFRAPDKDQNPTCVKCQGALKDQPIIGMTVLYGLKKDGDEYSGGQILDPSSGKVYKGKLSVADEGRKLNVRGYIGVPLLGRTQTWLREE